MKTTTLQFASARLSLRKTNIIIYSESLQQLFCYNETSLSILRCLEEHAIKNEVRIFSKVYLGASIV